MGNLIKLCEVQKVGSFVELMYALLFFYADNIFPFPIGYMQKCERKNISKPILWTYALLKFAKICHKWGVIIFKLMII